MESFTIELVWNASVQLFPEITFNIFTNFVPEQLNLECQWEVTFSELSYLSKYQIVTKGKFTFLKKNFQNLQSSNIRNLVFTPALRILLRPSTLSFKKDTITAKTVSQLKCLEERKKLKFTLQMEDLLLRSLVRTWDKFWKVLLEITFVSCWEKKDLTDLNLTTTFSAYIPSWYIQTWLSINFLVTQRLHYCVAFLLSQR